MVKEKKKIKKKAVVKKSVKSKGKKQPKTVLKKRRKKEQPANFIFDSTIGKTDSLFVEKPEQENQTPIAEFASLNTESQLASIEEETDKKPTSWWKKISFFKKFFVILILAAGIVLPVLAVAATINSEQKYAWSDQLGWINFGCANCDVEISNSGITGYAWSENYGWINFSPTGGGVLMSPSGSGILTGYAWGESAGWINFNGVTIDSSGNFTGAATLENSVFDCQNSGAYCQIVFSCAEGETNNCLVSTDWRKGLGWIYVETDSSVSTERTSEIQIIINGATEKTNNPVVTLDFQKVPTNIVEVIMSENPNFSGANYQAFEKTKKFVFSAGDGNKTVYVKFLDKDGAVSNTFLASIMLYTQLPSLNIDKLKDSYLSNEDIIVSGTSIANASILLGWAGKYGLVGSDSKGEWMVNLGRLPAGGYNLIITAKDDMGNSKTTSTSILVHDLAKTSEQEETKVPVGPLLKNISEKISSFISPLSSKKKVPLPVITISKKMPEILKSGWNLLPVKAQRPIIY